MKKHLTVDGWKRCKAQTKPCPYGTHNNDAKEHIERALKDAKLGKQGGINKFFDFLNTLIPEKPTATSPAVTVSIQPLNETKVDIRTQPTTSTLTINAEGRYTTYAAGYSEEPLLHTFSDLTTDEESIKKLHDADTEKFYQTGDCGVIANEIWNHNKHVDGYYVFKTEDETGPGLHDFVKLKDGTYADSLGIWTEGALLKTWKNIEPKGYITPWENEEGTKPAVKDTTTPISNPQLFQAMTEIINTHMAKATQKNN